MRFTLEEICLIAIFVCRTRRGTIRSLADNRCRMDAGMEEILSSALRKLRAMDDEDFRPEDFVREAEQLQACPEP